MNALRKSYYSKIHQKKATPKLQEHILMDLLKVMEVFPI